MRRGIRGCGLELIGREKKQRLERGDEHDEEDDDVWSNSAEQGSPMELDE
jgi:hypothetical protein